MLYSDALKIDPAYRERLEQVGLSSVPSILARLGERVAAWSRTTDTVYVRGPAGQPGFYLKRYLYPRWRKRLRGALRGTLLGKHRGLAEFRALQTMRRLGVPAIRPVAYGSRHVGPFLTACFLITEEAPDSVNRTTVARQATPGPSPLSYHRRAALCRALAGQVARMHAAGFVHGKLFWRNILVREPPGGEPELFFLDARPPRRVERIGATRQLRREDLSHLAASALPFTTRTDRLRFMRAHAGGKVRARELHKELDAILRRAARFDRHEAQRIKMNDLFDLWNVRLARSETPATADAAAAATLPA
jgi:hypothetical protein